MSIWRGINEPPVSVGIMSIGGYGMLLSERSIYKMHVLILVIRAPLLVLGYSKFFRHFLYWPWLLLLMAWRQLAGHVGQARESDPFVGAHIAIYVHELDPRNIFNHEFYPKLQYMYNVCVYTCNTFFFFFSFFFLP